MTPTGRIAPPAEDGFALIEVLVSALVIALVAAGVMALLQATARSAADQRSHAVAYAVAQEDQARLRSLRLSYLNRLNEKREISIDGSEFTIESTGSVRQQLHPAAVGLHLGDDSSRLRPHHLDGDLAR